MAWHERSDSEPISRQEAYRFQQQQGVERLLNKMVESGYYGPKFREYWLKQFKSLSQYIGANMEGTETKRRTCTEEYIMSQIVSEESFKLGKKTTVVLLTLKNGFEVVGKSGCVDPANYKHEMGVEVARKRAIDQIWFLEGYTLQNELNEACCIVNEDKYAPGPGSACECNEGKDIAANG